MAAAYQANKRFFKKKIIVLFSICFAYGKDQTISSIRLCFFITIIVGKSSSVNWGKKERKERPSRFARKIQRTERELPFCRLVEGEKNWRWPPWTHNLSAICALCWLKFLIWVFFGWPVKGHCRQEMNSPAAAAIQRSAPAFFSLLPSREKVPWIFFPGGGGGGHEMAD